MSKIDLSLRIDCAVKGAGESISIKFLKPKLFIDVNNISLRTYEISAQPYRRPYISSSAMDILSASGATFEAANIGVLTLTLGKIFLQ
jgi:hypothetical protein